MKEITSWNDIPISLRQLFSNISSQLRFWSISKKSEMQTIQHIVQLVTEFSEQNLFDENLKYWEKEFWRIIRYHNNNLRIDITFSADYGVPFYTLRIAPWSTEHPKTMIFYTQGTNLWKRYKKAVVFLKQYYGDKVYIYDQEPK